MDIVTSSDDIWSTDTPYTPVYNTSHTDEPANSKQSASTDNEYGYVIVFKYVAPIVILMGTIGNILSVIVLQSRYFRRAPSAFILSALSLTDTSVLLCGLMRHWLVAMTNFALDLRDLSKASCLVHIFFTYYLPHLSSWSLALLTIERMSSVRWPFKAKQLFSKPRMISMWVITALLLAAFNSKTFKTFKFEEANANSTSDANTTIGCTFREDTMKFEYFVWPWIDLMLISIIPMAIILSCNVLIGVVLVKARKLRKGKMQANSTDESGAVTAMLIGASVLFFFATIPSSIYFIVVHYWPPVTSEQKARTNTAYSLVNIVYYLSNSLNFIVYCLSGSKFRQALVAILCCRQGKMPEAKSASKYSLSTIEGSRPAATSTTELN